MKHIIKQHLDQILEEAEKRINKSKETIDWEKLSTKLKSELISNIIETSFSTIVPHTYDPKKDSEPDLYIHETPLEIKTSKTTHTWRGGEYSKRNGNFLLIGWGEIDNHIKWFVLFTNLNENHWNSSKSKNYYATTIKLSDVLKLQDTEILYGKTIKKRINHHILYE